MINYMNDEMTELEWRDANIVQRKDAIKTFASIVNEDHQKQLITAFLGEIKFYYLSANGLKQYQKNSVSTFK